MDLFVHLESPFGLATLAAIAFGDTLIGIGLFVFGEFAFLAAGAAYAANSSVVPALIVLAFAWLGDITSFLLGRRYGARAALRFMKTSKNRKRWRRAEKRLAERGFLFVVLSRFLGPVAWITPFLSGTIGMPMSQYASAAAVGVILGVGQFLVWGAIGQTAMTYLLPHITPHLSVLALLVLMFSVGVYIWRRSVRSRLHKAMTISGAATLMLLAANFAYFFVLDSHPVPAAPKARIADVCSVSRHHLAVTPGPSALHLPQPVNVLLFSENPGAEMMAELNWHRNATYSHDAITFAKFISLLWHSRPPMSELYLDGQPADSAFQMPGSIKVREHIRWWNVGQGLHFGALSKTDEIAIKYYGSLPAIIHDIDPKVDLSRDLLATQVADSGRYDVVGLAKIAQPIGEDEFGDFETDGGVLVLADKGHDLPGRIRECLRIQPFARQVEASLGAYAHATL